MPLNSEQISIITSAYSELHAEVRANQDLEHKIAFAVGGLFIVFAALIPRKEVGLISGYETLEFWLITLFLAGVAIVATFFLVTNVKEMRWQCQRIVSCEKAMGLYRDNEFLTNERIIPIGGMEWGKKNHLAFNSLPFIFGIWLSFAAAVAALSIVFYENQAKKVKQSELQPEITLNLPEILLPTSSVNWDAFQTFALLDSRFDQIDNEIVDLSAAIKAALVHQADAQNSPPPTKVAPCYPKPRDLQRQRHQTHPPPAPCRCPCPHNRS